MRGTSTRGRGDCDSPEKHPPSLLGLMSREDEAAGSGGVELVAHLEVGSMLAQDTDESEVEGQQLVQEGQMAVVVLPFLSPQHPLPAAQLRRLWVGGSSDSDTKESVVDATR